MRIPSRDERIAHQQTTLRQSAQVLLQGAIREAMDISGIEIPDETMTEMQELVTILNNYRNPKKRECQQIAQSHFLPNWKKDT